MSTNLRNRIRERLEGMFPGARIRSVEAPVGERGEGLIIEVPPGAPISMRITRLSAVRRDDLEGLFARRILRNQTGPKLALLVTAPGFGRTAAETVRTFVEQHQPDLEWALVGDDGRIFAAMPAVGLVGESRSGPGIRKRPFQPVTSASLPLSDLNRWLLKLLLLGTDRRAGPESPFIHATDLSRRGGVSLATASRFVSAFRAADYLRDDQEGLGIVRRAALVLDWLAVARINPAPRVPVRGLYGPPVLSVGPADAESEDWWAYGGFHACHLWGTSITTNTGAREVHVSGIDRAAEAWRLTPSDEHDAHLLLIDSSHTESIRRAATAIDGGPPVVDLLQAALDVVPHANRGREQADHIIDQALGWSD